MFCVFFGKKRKCGTRDEVRAVSPKRSHSSRAWDDYEVAFVFTTYVMFVCVFVVFDDRLRKRTHHRFLFFVYLYDFHFIGSLFTALSKL